MSQWLDCSVALSEQTHDAMLFAFTKMSQVLILQEDGKEISWHSEVFRCNDTVPACTANSKLPSSGARQKTQLHQLVCFQPDCHYHSIHT